MISMARRLKSPLLRHFASSPGGVEQVIYDPSYEENLMLWEQKMGALRKIKRKESDELLHGEEGGMIYKYDLPVLNMPIVFHNKLATIDESKELTTETQELFELLDCDKDTAYESFIIKFNQEYNHEVDMYGNI